VLLWAAPLAAQEASDVRCPTIDGGSSELAELPIDERMAFLLGRTRSGHEAATLWSVTFAVGYLGLAAGQLGAMVLLGGLEENVNLWVGAIAAVIGVGTRILMPRAVLADRALIEELAPAAASGDCEALARAEAVFVRDAEDEAFGSSWLIHVGAILFNLARGVYLGLVHDEWISGAIGAGIGIAVGELQIFTQPTDLVGALEQYRTGRLRAEPASEPRAAASVPVNPLGGLVLGVGGAF
jgi:MFS family permease